MPEQSHWTERWADFVLSHRGLVIFAVLLICAGLASQIPSIETDPSAENLIASFEGGDSAEDRFYKDFPSSPTVVAILISADDVFESKTLSYVNELTKVLAGVPKVRTSESITNIIVPRREVAASKEETLDEIDLDDLDDLEDTEEEASEAQADSEADTTNALVEVIEADPIRFSGGLKSIGPKLQRELKYDRVIAEEATQIKKDDAERLRRALSKTPLEARMVSKDHKVALIALTLSDVSAKETSTVVDDIEGQLGRVSVPDGVTTQLAGLPYLRNTITQSIKKDQIVLVPLTLVVCILLLLISFRWLPGVLLPIVSVAITALMVVGGMALVGEPMNILNNIIPSLLIIIGISDSIHLVGRYREEVAETGDGLKAAKTTIATMSVACLLTSVTTSVGLGALLVSKTVMLRHFGVTAALGVMCAYLVTISFLPAALNIFPVPKVTIRSGSGWLENGIERLTRSVMSVPWLVLFATLAFLVGGVYAAVTKLEVDHALLDQFSEDEPVYKTTVLMEKKFGGVRPLEVSLLGDKGSFGTAAAWNAIDEVAEWSAARPEVINTFSASSILHETWTLLSGQDVRQLPFHSDRQVASLISLLSLRTKSPLTDWVTTDRTHARFQIRVRDVGAQQTMKFIDDLESELNATLKEKGVRADVGFTGEAYNGSLGLGAVVSDLSSSLLAAVLIIFVLLLLLLRDVRLGLISIPPNLVPLVGTLVYMVLRDVPLNAANVIIFSISLGLAVDGTIHVLARYREEITSGRTGDEALIRAARGTGRAIVISSVTLMAGFSVLMLSSFVPVRRFGELIAVTIVGCLFATIVVQPALLKVAGSRRQAAKVPASRKPSSSH